MMATESNGHGLSDDANEEFDRPKRRSGRNRRGNITDIDQKFVKKESYDESISILQRSIVGSSCDVQSSTKTSFCKTNADKMRNLFDKHLEQYRTSTDKDAEYDEDFLLEAAEMDLNELCSLPLREFEEMERRRNEDRRPSRRTRASMIKSIAWHQKHTLKQVLKIANQSPCRTWLSSFYRCDPRWQIMRFFDEVAREGGDVPVNEHLAASPLPDLFSKASVFTVWRPTSNEAIQNMMLGIACGKGLDIKGKSAKKGNISSYVPFIQIFESQHKIVCNTFMKRGNMIRIFYQNEECRDAAHDMIAELMQEMDKGEFNIAPKIQDIVEFYDKPRELYALDIEETLFWECHVTRQDCSRDVGTEWDIGRKSQPEFMEMNMNTIRRQPGPDEPRAVVFQMSKSNPLEPRMLLMAYEENGSVKPVVSDFDCFILGTRGVKYKSPIPPDQIELLQWSVRNIGKVLDERDNGILEKKNWMETWFDVLNNSDGYHPETPRFGNGDPKSYEIIEVGVSRLQDTGCVRHGAECFNWFFPQEIDDQFLVISDTLPGNIKWKKMNVHELQEILIEKIEQGFTFPINPKWVLCDLGWKRVYDKLLASKYPNVQDSINCWLPPSTGLREQIEDIAERHPLGFEYSGQYRSFTRDMMMLNALEQNYSPVSKSQREFRASSHRLTIVRRTSSDI